MTTSACELWESLQKLKLTKEKLPGTIILDSAPTITNEVVLDLFYFMNRSPECMYHTLSQWLSSLSGEWCPKEEFSTVKSICQSVLCLYSRLSRLKKSQSRDQNVATFLNIASLMFLLPTTKISM